MITLPLRTVPGLVWPAIPDGRMSQLWALHLELERTQLLEPAAVVEGQLAQARTLLAHCAETLWRDVLPPSVGSTAENRPSAPVSNARSGIWSVAFQRDE